MHGAPDKLQAQAQVFPFVLSQTLVLKATNNVTLRIPIIKKWIFISS